MRTTSQLPLGRHGCRPFLRGSLALVALLAPALVATGSAAAAPTGFDLRKKAGIKIVGDAGDTTGHSVASAGDVDGDGIVDTVIGAPFADKRGRRDAGSAYIVYGRKDRRSVDLAVITSSRRGIRVDGAEKGDLSGEDEECAPTMNDCTCPVGTARRSSPIGRIARPRLVECDRARIFFSGESAVCCAARIGTARPCGRPGRGRSRSRSGQRLCRRGGR